MGFADTLSGIASGAGEGLSRIAPYALSAGMGAAMGGPMGALAGLAASEPTAEQQRLALEAEKWQVEKQQLGLALRSEQDKEDAARNISDPEMRQLFRTNPSAYIQQRDWDLYQKQLQGDPGFAQSQHGTDATGMPAFKGLPSAVGMKVLTAFLQEKARMAASGKFPNGIKGPFSDDNGKTFYSVGLGPIGSDGKPIETRIPLGGVPERVQAARERPAESAAAPKTTLKTLYGTGENLGRTKTQRVTLKPGEEYTPPEGWSLARPSKADENIAAVKKLLGGEKGGGAKGVQKSVSRSGKPIWLWNDGKWHYSPPK